MLVSNFQSRNTLRVRLDQKKELYKYLPEGQQVAILCEYDYIKSLKEGDFLQYHSYVAILCEYDYIKSSLVLLFG